MAETASTMAPLGMEAPPFSLNDVTSGETVTLEDFEEAEGLLVIFMCAHCPFVKHVQDGIAELARDFREQGIEVVGISSNNVETHPGDSPENLARQAEEVGFDFPYLFDETQEVAQAYGAACTPDFFLFDQRRKLFYRGQMDDSRPGNGVPVTGRDLRNAASMLMKQEDPPERQKASMGCNIKWKPGNAPDYAG